MDDIKYSWNLDEEDSQIHDISNEQFTRHDMQYPRRAFHFLNGFVVAVLYGLFLSHTQMIRFLGGIACAIYIMEQIRINYPQLAQKINPLTKFIIRAEEQLKESAVVPYAFAVLLTIITFPKPVALVGILTLAIADPLSALIGIKFGKMRLVKHKSLEGSAAFFVSTFLVCFFTLQALLPVDTGLIFIVSLLLAFISSCFEMLPLKIDDNITIPLFVAFILWVLLESFGVSF